MFDFNDLIIVGEKPAEANGKPLAMAFVNRQPAPDTMDVNTAFVKGTLFYDLDKPFMAGGNVG